MESSDWSTRSFPTQREIVRKRTQTRKPFPVDGVFLKGGVGFPHTCPSKNSGEDGGESLLQNEQKKLTGGGLVLSSPRW